MDPRHVHDSAITDGHIGPQAIDILGADRCGSLEIVEVSNDGIGRRCGLIEIDANGDLSALDKICVRCGIGGRESRRRPILEDGLRSFGQAETRQRDAHTEPGRTASDAAA